MRRPLNLSALLTPLVLAACLEPDPVPESNYGVIGLSTSIAGSDTTLNPEAIFYRSGLLGLPTSSVTSDQCQVANYPPLGGEGTIPRFLDAGDSVAVSTVDSTIYLFPTVEANREIYAVREPDRLPFHPGERVTVTVRGAPGGFANGTASVLTASPFTLGSIDPAPPAGEDLNVTWTPAGDDSTKMLLSLQYGANDTQANQQIFCSLIDDGQAEIPAFLVNQWRTATTGTRRAEAARWRVAIEQVNDGVLVVVSAFEVQEFVD